MSNAFSGSSSGSNRGNTNYQSSAGGGSSGGGGGSGGTEAYSGKQGQAVKGANSSAPSSKGFHPLAKNPDGKALGFLGRVCNKNNTTQEDVNSGQIKDSLSQKEYANLGLDVMGLGANVNSNAWNVFKGFLQAPLWKVYNDGTKGTELENKDVQNDLVYKLSNSLTSAMPDFVGDITISYNFPLLGLGGAVGYSKVMSFDIEKNANYIHPGVGSATPGINISLAFGVVSGMENKLDYTGDFVDYSANAFLGFSHAEWTNSNQEKIESNMFTINAFPGAGVRYDYYSIID